MSNSYFKFKQFTIEQGDCAMKVGTDGCLLGGWFDCSQSSRILDIGTGSGLIAIMAAQRSNATVTGIEIDASAARQARENADNSPWGNRIEIINGDLLKYNPEETFDTIVSNPPYFVNSLKCDDSSRPLARHSVSLGRAAFFDKADKLLSKNGKISIIIPCDIENEWRSSANSYRFAPIRIAYIKTTPRKEAKRVLIEFCKGDCIKCNESILILENKPGVYSDEAREILRDFYLKIV